MSAFVRKRPNVPSGINKECTLPIKCLCVRFRSSFVLLKSFQNIKPWPSVVSDHKTKAVRRCGGNESCLVYDWVRTSTIPESLGVEPLLLRTEKWFGDLTRSPPKSKLHQIRPSGLIWPPSDPRENSSGVIISHSWFGNVWRYINMKEKWKENEWKINLLPSLRIFSTIFVRSFTSDGFL